MNAFTFSIALLMGFTGSLHCAGMCGPIMWVMPFQMLHGIQRALGIALYHFGRITCYAMMALVLHSFRGLFQPQVQQHISIGLGVLLLLAGILSFLLPGHAGIKIPWASFVKNQLGRVMGKQGLPVLLATGFLNGLLPCGLVYMALSASVSINDAWQAAGLMYVFGAGTIPMLVAITVLKNRAPFLRIRNVQKMVPYMMFAFGCLFILRGMNLGIPYLSPEVALGQQGIETSCCHKMDTSGK